MSVFTLIRSILSLKSGDQNFFFLLEKRFFYLLMGSGWVAHRVFAIRLVQRLGWVFETQERKKERKLSQVCDLDLSGAGLFPPGFLLLPWQVSPTMEVRSKAENPVVLRPERLLWAGRGRLLAIICLHCLPRLVIFGKTGNNFVRGPRIFVMISPFCTIVLNFKSPPMSEMCRWSPGGGWGEYKLRYLNHYTIFECWLTSTLN